MMYRLKVKEKVADLFYLNEEKPRYLRAEVGNLNNLIVGGWEENHLADELWKKTFDLQTALELLNEYEGVLKIEPIGEE